ncbi:MAG: caspase family protein [Rhizobiales bacterium]|nr:caspase family protein [Hyphomicrobiales bacterium]
MLRLARLLLTTASVVAMAGAAEAATERVALIIGNGAYQTESPLANPPNDAADVAALLRALGFEVIEGRDLSKRDLERKLKEFRAKLEEIQPAADFDPDTSPPVALFYYSGHGIQVAGRNFVIPVDAKIDKPADVDFETVDMDAILRAMQGDAWASVVVLDACRDNPFARSLARSLKGATRGGESAFQGLAEMCAQNGSFVIYATDPGNVALDGNGRNSPFTSAFLKNAPKPGIDLSRMMISIRYDVMRATGDKQNPRDTSSLMRPVFLGGAPAPARIQQASLPADPMVREGASAPRVLPIEPKPQQPAPAPAPKAQPQQPDAKPQAAPSRRSIPTAPASSATGWRAIRKIRCATRITASSASSITRRRFRPARRRARPTRRICATPTSSGARLSSPSATTRRRSCSP